MPGRQRQFPPLPTLWLFTDERIAEARLIGAATRLPRGSGIVLRHYGLAETKRKALFGTLHQIARRRGLLLLLAGDAKRAIAWGADGVHARTYARLPKHFIRSAPVHDRAELRAAERNGAHIAFLSPLFATRSHPGAQPLGPARFAAIATSASIRVMALGGVKQRHARLIRSLGASGFGAIDSFHSRVGRHSVNDGSGGKKL